jgi:transposase
MDEDLDAPGIGESAHAIGRRSARSQRLEIITRGERRWVWTLEQKREIVAESFGPELTPTEVARKFAISSGQLYTWHHQLLSMPNAVIRRTVPRFTEVELAPTSPNTPGPVPIDEHAAPVSPAPVRFDGMIEIALRGGVVLRVDGQVDGRALRRVLDTLERR